MKRTIVVLLAAAVIIAVSAFGAQYGYDRFNDGGTDATGALFPPASTNGGALGVDSILVVWSKSESGRRVELYEVERDGIPIATTNLLSFIDLDLEPGTAYTYRIRAGDGTEWSDFTGPIELVTNTEAP